MEINIDAFTWDSDKFKEWTNTFKKCLPGGWGEHQDWLLDNGTVRMQTSDWNVNGPQDENTLLSNFPEGSPLHREDFGEMYGSEQYFQDYIEACRSIYEYVSDGTISMALLEFRLLQTLNIYYETYGYSHNEIDELRRRIEEL